VSLSRKVSILRSKVPNNPFKNHLLELTHHANSSSEVVIGDNRVNSRDSVGIFGAMYGLAALHDLTLGLETTSSGLKCIVGDTAHSFDVFGAKVEVGVNSKTNLSPVPPSILKLSIFPNSVNVLGISLFAEGVAQRLEFPRNPKTRELVAALGDDRSFDLLCTDELIGHFTLLSKIRATGAIGDTSIRLCVPIALSPDPRFAFLELLPFLGDFTSLLPSFGISPEKPLDAKISDIRRFGLFLCDLKLRGFPLGNLISLSEIEVISKAINDSDV
jgi:hypothetical protein